MSIGEKIAKLRKDNDHTQEQLADLLGVSRQAVSKWESDIAYPETDNLIKLGELYNCSMDYLLKDDVEQKSAAENAPTVENNGTTSAPARFDIRNFYFERKSSRMVGSLPLWHINIGVGRTAKGIFAVGIKAKGIVSLGVLSMGVLSMGVLSLGVFALGALALGLIAAGSVSVGFIAMGAICLGVIALGAIAVGEFSVGALAVGKYFAMGDHAQAIVAIGKTKVVGEAYSAVAITKANYAEVVSALKANTPEIFHWLIELIKPMLNGAVR